MQRPDRRRHSDCFHHLPSPTHKKPSWSPRREQPTATTTAIITTGPPPPGRFYAHMMAGNDSILWELGLVGVRRYIGRNYQAHPIPPVRTGQHGNSEGCSISINDAPDAEALKYVAL